VASAEPDPIGSNTGLAERISTMASAARVNKMITLKEFLRMPEIDEHLYLEYIDGKAEAKVTPQGKHSSIETKLAADLNVNAEPRGRPGAFVELRSTFAGRSIIPDVVFRLEDHIEVVQNGEILDPTLHPPDIHVEIASPDRPIAKCSEKRVFSTANGCRLGWHIDPDRKTVDVYEPGRPQKRLPDQGVLTGFPVLPRYRLSLVELFGWLQRRKALPPSTRGPSGSSSAGDPT
jgi:Uma2 family endonuclease